MKKKIVFSSSSSSRSPRTRPGNAFDADDKYEIKIVFSYQRRDNARVPIARRANKSRAINRTYVRAYDKVNNITDASNKKRTRYDEKASCFYAANVFTVCGEWQARPTGVNVVIDWKTITANGH